MSVKKKVEGLKGLNRKKGRGKDAWTKFQGDEVKPASNDVCWSLVVHY